MLGFSDSIVNTYSKHVEPTHMELVKIVTYFHYFHRNCQYLCRLIPYFSACKPAPPPPPPSRERINEIEHEGMGTCARIEISQDADKHRPTSKMVSESS